MHLPNLKFVALSVTEIIGATPNIWEVPGYAHAPISPKFFTGFCLDGPCEIVNVSAKFEVRALPVPEIIRGYSKNFRQFLHTPALPFSKSFDGFVQMDPVNIPAKFEVGSFTRS